MGGSRDLAGSRRALRRSARRRRPNIASTIFCNYTLERGARQFRSGFLFDETEPTAPRLASAGRRCWPPRPCRRRSWTPNALPRRPSYRAESAGRPCPLIRRYGSPPCFLSGISGWRGGALYPLRVAYDHRPLNFVTFFAIFGAHSLFAVETLDHFDRGSHVGCKLKHADALRNPHGGVGVPERVGTRSFPSDPRRTPASVRTCSNPFLKLPMGRPLG